MDMLTQQYVLATYRVPLHAWLKPLSLVDGLLATSFQSETNTHTHTLKMGVCIGKSASTMQHTSGDCIK